MDPEKSPSRRGSRARFAAASVLVLALVAAGAFAIGRLSAPVASAPSTTSAEAGYARDMQTHHAQAVELAMIVRDESDDPDIRLLAYDIATSQSQQAGQMFGWLAEWKLPQAESEPSMTWMTRPPISGGTGHDHGEGDSAHTAGDPMPGLATPEQITELKSLTGVDAEKLFLELMIAHHKGGVLMSEALLDRSDERVVVSLATSIVQAQTSEIGYMQDLLAARG
jgi:uncharacterized protein (DUF305 family)